ncbi:hypothetical protein H0H87_008558 [Tephrocybe sp. NHM501043]|nr:hypothetical protein H0H87_008558 [Tephrocybe sp. NHM501043]
MGFQGCISVPMKFTLIFASALVAISQSPALALALGNHVVNVEVRATAACGDPRAILPLLRAWNPRVGDHFYTTNAPEMQNAVTRLGYIGEGTTGYVFTNQQPSTVPLYRLYQPSVSDHFYTTSAPERDNAVSAYGYTYEGVAGYIYPNGACGGMPLYRSYHGGIGDHFYTMSEVEKNNAQGGGWAYEGIAGYMFPY